MPARHQAIGQPKHAGEKRGIDMVVNALPDNYQVYSNVDLATGRRGGQTYEHDLLILAPHAVFTVELKSWGGRITGNRDRWQLDDGTVVQSPIPLVLDKARTLKGSLTTKSKALREVWVQGIVVVSGTDALMAISPDYAHLVATKRDVARMLTDPSVWGLSGQRLTRAQERDVLNVFSDGVPVSLPTRIGQYELIERLASEGRPFDAWLGKAAFGERRILHVYEVRGDNDKARKRVRDHALREATLHARLKGGPDLLDYCEYEIIEHPHSIVLRFEDTTPLLPASTWIATHKPGLEDRLRVARRVAAALAWIHDRSIVHRRLSIDAILVSPDPSPAAVRLTALELARDLTGQAPSVSAGALVDPSYRAMAPELLRTGEATIASDRFSLGAVLFELFNGRPLFEHAEDALHPFEIPPLHVGGEPAPAELTRLVRLLLALTPNDRPACAEVAQHLDKILADAGRPSAAPRREALKAGDRIHDYTLVEHLGEGATGTIWKVQHALLDRTLAAKIADAEHADALKHEAEALGIVHHPNLIRVHDLASFEGGAALLLDYTDGVDGRTWAGAGDPLAADQLLVLGEGLFGALGALHDAGFLHRDVKPENVILSKDARPTLIDLGLVRRMEKDRTASGELTVGSVAYKDPLLWETRTWTPAFDLFAAWLVIYEIMTGAHPFHGRPESGERPSINVSMFPDTLPEPIAAHLGALFQDALSPDLAARPPTAEAAIERLRAVLAPSSPPLPIPITSPPPAPPPAPRNLDQPSTLAELAAALKREIGAEFARLSVRAGLVDGVVRTSEEAPRADLADALRSGSSAAAWLLGTTSDLLPRAGFAPVDVIARALPARLPSDEGTSALGYARLAAVLLQPAASLDAIDRVSIVARPPWTDEAITTLRDALITHANWPPLPLAGARDLVWRTVSPEIQGALRRFGADAGALLQATLALCPDVARTPEEALFTPPVSFEAALEKYRPKLRVGIGPDALVEALRQEYQHVADPTDLRAALTRVGLALRDGLVVEAVEEPERPPAPVLVDPIIPRKRVGPGGAIDIKGLLAALPQGGFRVTALAPGRHHVLSEQLTAALRDARGPDLVRFIDVDRTLIEALKDADLWDDAVIEDGRSEPRWGWASSALRDGLERAVIGPDARAPLARPGVTTVLARPSLLGPLGLMDWLSGLYERSRGGRYGLIVLALPGGVHDGRVRLNELYGLPYTPDMAAICLLEEGDLAA